MILSYVLATTLFYAPTVEVRDAYRRPPLQKPAPREDRNMAVVAELGWNSIAGLGVSYTYHVHPQVAIDAGGGLGVSRALLRAGGRVRYNFLRLGLTPYMALGMTVVPGGRFDVSYAKEGLASEVDRVSVSVRTTPAVQGTVGLSWQSEGGFVAQCGLGYSYNLRTPYAVHGALSQNDRQTLETLFGNGVALNLGFGHAF